MADLEEKKETAQFIHKYFAIAVCIIWRRGEVVISVNCDKLLGSVVTVKNIKWVRYDFGCLLPVCYDFAWLSVVDRTINLQNVSKHEPSYLRR